MRPSWSIHCHEQCIEDESERQREGFTLTGVDAMSKED